MNRFGVIILLSMLIPQAKSTEVYICGYYEVSEETEDTIYECKLITEQEPTKNESQTTFNPDDYSFLNF